MEALAARIAAFCLQKHYIEPDQIAWLHFLTDGGALSFFCWSSASFVCGQADTMLKRQQDAF